MYTRFTLFSLLILLSGSVFAQTGYNLQFKITGLNGQPVLLGYYYGESTYAKDTANASTRGEFSFQGKTPLDQGVYFLAVDKNRLFEFVIGEDQTFKIETDTADYIQHMKVTGDIDNTLFLENMLNNAKRHKEAEPYIAIIQDSTLRDEEKVNARESFAKINEKVIDFHKEIIKKHPNTMTARLFKISQPLAVPTPPRNADGKVDSTFQLRWYRAHFFDNMDLADDAMLRLPRPFYSEKVHEYLDKLFVPNPDTLINAMTQVINMAKPNPETYKYVVWQLMIKYQNPEYMGLDKIFVHLYDSYFATGDMDSWANAKMKQNLKEHADRLRKSLIGQKGANLVMQDENFQKQTLYDIQKKYTIVYFFDPDCGHCKKETPKLVTFYNKNKDRFNLEVFAVSADTSMQAMRDYIKDMKMPWITVNGPRTYVGHYQELYDSNTTPTLYVLDDKKKIIAKKIPAEKLEEFLVNYEKFQRDKENPERIN